MQDPLSPEVGGGVDRIACRAAVAAAFERALAASDPAAALHRICRREDDLLYVGSEDALRLDDFPFVHLVGAGKATPRMAAAMVPLLSDRIAGGTITTRDGHGLPIPDIDLWEAGHPLPDARGLAGAAEALRRARACGPHDLLVCLLSGGASALWTAPVGGVSLGDLRAVTRRLLASGAPIGELNAVRKHLSRIAGGHLALECRAARILTLAVSDVVDSPAEVIGSGPTVPDPTTFADALEVLHSREIESPPSVWRHLQRGLVGAVPETGKDTHPRFATTSFHLIASIHDALEGAAESLVRNGYEVRVVSTRMEGESRAVGRDLARLALEAALSARGPLALLWGGETTVTVRGSGHGGRSQEMALAAAIELAGVERIVVGCLATDGSDGPTDAAGGIVDGGTVARAAIQGVDAGEALSRNDSNALLRASGDLVITGPTGTNVNDVVIALIG